MTGVFPCNWFLCSPLYFILHITKHSESGVQGPHQTSGDVRGPEFQAAVALQKAELPLGLDVLSALKSTDLTRSLLHESGALSARPRSLPFAGTFSPSHPLSQSALQVVCFNQSQEVKATHSGFILKRHLEFSVFVTKGNTPHPSLSKMTLGTSRKDV